MQAATGYPSVKVEEYPAEGGIVVACHGGLAQEDPAAAPARLQPFSEAWASYASSNGTKLHVRGHVWHKMGLLHMSAWLV